ncbi:META domain-containing protein [Hymenobacter weizhouensis]|uniref:META domain-containing protein n=1 Tax=Hymenobacter sp. YIM 151500-1 TaxID=2987689 RepID=UPI002227A2C6|nr:META domain-containing protein [Hymenobacter sp. YIM 151500-1]UYZ62698.1 META domain-containing protein [Hymenobacter sp. YIM 151500-1]
MLPLSPLRSTLLLAALLGLGSCAKDDAPVPAPVYLLDQRWVLTQVQGQPVPAGTPETTLLLESVGNVNGGRAACNTYGGLYTLAAGTPQLRFTAQSSTRATCPEQAQETIYLQLLPNTARYAISNGTLRLYNDTHATPLLEFRAGK